MFTTLHGKSNKGHILRKVANCSRIECNVYFSLFQSHHYNFNAKLQPYTFYQNNFKLATWNVRKRIFFLSILLCTIDRGEMNQQSTQTILLTDSCVSLYPESNPSPSQISPSLSQSSKSLVSGCFSTECSFFGRTCRTLNIIF